MIFVGIYPYLGIRLYRDGHRFCERTNFFFMNDGVEKKRLKIFQTKLINDSFLFFFTERIQTKIFNERTILLKTKEIDGNEC